MSNPLVGAVYQQIIKDVVETSRVDFEEGGVEESVLEELAMGWQKKLSALGVAQFPWDPKLEPTPAPVPQQAPVNAGYHQMDTPPMPQTQPSFHLPQLPTLPNGGAPHIKPEPGTEPLSLPAYPQAPSTGLTAQQRAAQNLQATYGARAAASINAIQGAMPMPQARPPTQPMQQNGQQNAPQQQQQGQRPGAPQRALTPAQYQQALAEMTARQRAQLQQSAGGSQAQTDGAGDDADELFFGVVKRVDALGHEVEMGRIEIDNMIRERILAKGKAMEGGGLMMPLQKAPKRRRVESSTTTSVNGPHPAVASSSSSTVPSAQFDGAADDDDDDNKDGIIKDEDLDEDAINSDLDDPEDALNDDDDDDENLGNIMLCMYDKVQRVKNKWKCVMKDGVLTVNGKEYVFHKATGEYEW